MSPTKKERSLITLVVAKLSTMEVMAPSSKESRFTKVDGYFEVANIVANANVRASNLCFFLRVFLCFFLFIFILLKFDSPNDVRKALNLMIKLEMCVCKRSRQMHHILSVPKPTCSTKNISIQIKIQ